MGTSTRPAPGCSWADTIAAARTVAAITNRIVRRITASLRCLAFAARPVVLRLPVRAGCTLLFVDGAAGATDGRPDTDPYRLRMSFRIRRQPRPLTGPPALPRSLNRSRRDAVGHGTLRRS